MFVAATVCPHPPLLVPEVAAGAAAELDDLRASCIDAVRDLLDSGIERLVVVGAGADLRATRVTGSLRPYGVDVVIGQAGGVPLPLSLTVGAWLLEQVGGAPRVEYVGLGADTPPADAADRLGSIVIGPDRVGVLAMADLSAKRTTTSPGYVDPRAVSFDDAVVAALAGADLAALVGLDPALAGELWCSGASALAAVAGAARTVRRPVRADLRAYVAPYGVGYAVVRWTVA